MIATSWRTTKTKGTDKQPTDGANSEANANGYRMEASGENTDAAPLSETPTTTNIMSAINRLSQVVDKRFDTFQISLAELKRTMADVEESATSNESGLR